jgi:hypothetical protein
MVGLNLCPYQSVYAAVLTFYLMKTSFFSCVLMLAVFAAPLLRAANDTVVGNLMAEIKSHPENTAALAVRAATDHRDQAGAIFKAVFGTVNSEEQIKALLVETIKLAPEFAPVITQQAVARLTASAKTPEEAATLTASLTQLAITTAVATQTSSREANRLAAAIAASAVRALPDAAASVSKAAALAQPAAAPQIEHAVNSVIIFAPQPQQQAVVSPSS